MAEPPAPAEPTPLNRAEMAARITSGELTTDEAGALWGEPADGPTVEKLKRHDLFADLARGAMQGAQRARLGARRVRPHGVLSPAGARLRDDPDEARSQFGRALARYANVGMDEAAKELREEMAKVERL